MRISPTEDIGGVYYDFNAVFARKTAFFVEMVTE